MDFLFLPPQLMVSSSTSLFSSCTSFPFLQFCILLHFDVFYSILILLPFSPLPISQTLYSYSFLFLVSPILIAYYTAPLFTSSLLYTAKLLISILSLFFLSFFSSFILFSFSISPVNYSCLILSSHSFYRYPISFLNSSDLIYFLFIIYLSSTPLYSTLLYSTLLFSFILCASSIFPLLSSLLLIYMLSIIHLFTFHLFYFHPLHYPSLFFSSHSFIYYILIIYTTLLFSFLLFSSPPTYFTFIIYIFSYLLIFFNSILYLYSTSTLLYFSISSFLIYFYHFVPISHLSSLTFALCHIPHLCPSLPMYSQLLGSMAFLESMNLIHTGAHAQCGHATRI